MSIPKSIIEQDKGLDTWNIATFYRGSIAHGTYTPSKDPNSIDDKDVMAICVPPIEYYLGLKNYGSRGTKEIKQNEWDIVIYEFKKFIHLLKKQNPNVLMALWMENQDMIHSGLPWAKLLMCRDYFVSKQAFHSFTGYAYGQLHRMTHMAFQGYMGEKRKALVEKFGYDTKNASHLIRLLRMGIEYLNEGKLYVRRQDSHELLSIKRGEWTLEKVKSEAEELFKLSREAYTKSQLPDKIDSDKIDKICVEIITFALETNKNKKP